MGIRLLAVEGYRSLRDVKWSPGRLNVVIGPNASGKSNLLRALDDLRLAATGGLSAELTGRGGIVPLLWDGSAPALRWTTVVDPVRADAAEDESVTYELELERVGKSGAFRVSRELLASYRRVRRGEFAEPLKFLERTPQMAVTFDARRKRLAAQEGTVPEDQTLLSLVAGPFGNPIVQAFRNRCASWSIYRDLRVDQRAPIREAAVTRFEERVDPDGQNLIPALHTLYTNDDTFRESIDSAMVAAFGDVFQGLVFPPAADQRIQLRVRWRGLRHGQSAADLSDGTLRFLLLLTILASPNPGDLVAVEEPELGLHPRMLGALAEMAAEASMRTQVILTTHSRSFLDAFRPHMPLPTTTVTRWTEGSTELQVVDGEALRAWLEEYSLGSLFVSGELEALA